MKLSINIRNWGAQSTPAIMLACAKAADESGLDTLWLNEHLAIPPKVDMPDRVPQGFSEGRFLDPMATLAFLAASTKRIGLGTAVLLLPYRLPMQTAKLAATIQELSAGRLRLGVGVGWMKEEFQALGVDHSRRGAISDEVLALLQDCFANDVVEFNGQPFLFQPRPNATSTRFRLYWWNATACSEARRQIWRWLDSGWNGARCTQNGKHIPEFHQMRLWRGQPVAHPLTSLR